MTPLQSLIASRIQALEPARDTIVYQPHTNSPKHRYYFDAMVAEKKVFIDWIPGNTSYTLKQIRSFQAIPRHIRKNGFDEYLVSSFDALAFALLRGRKGILKTFDDGVLNLLPSEMELRLEREHWLLSALKRLAGGKNNRQTFGDSVRHYTVFDPPLLYPGVRDVTEVDLFDRTQLPTTRGKVSILLGSFLQGFAERAREDVLDMYQRLLVTQPHDIFLPHPADSRPARIASWLEERDALRDLIDVKIAEDFVLHLVRLSYDVTVYGVASTALINLARQVSTVNIIIPGLNDAEVAVFEASGVASLPFEAIAPIRLEDETGP